MISQHPVIVRDARGRIRVLPSGRARPPLRRKCEQAQRRAKRIQDRGIARMTGSRYDVAMAEKAEKSRDERRLCAGCAGGRDEARYGVSRPVRRIDRLAETSIRGNFTGITARTILRFILARGVRLRRPLTSINQEFCVSCSKKGRSRSRRSGLKIARCDYSGEPFETDEEAPFFVENSPSVATNRPVEISRDPRKIRISPAEKGIPSTTRVQIRVQMRTLPRRNDANIYSRGNFPPPESSRMSLFPCHFLRASCTSCVSRNSSQESDYPRRISSDVNVA